MTELVAIVVVAAACGLWALVQLRSGRQPRVCDGAGPCAGSARDARCAGCPRRGDSSARKDD